MSRPAGGATDANGPAPAAPRARDLALAALGDRAGNVTAHLNRLLSERQVAPAEAALARELAFGVVRRRATLDAVIEPFLRRRQRMPGRLRSVLRLGAYQLLFLQRVPDFAAVNEAVEQAGARAPHVRGFVNAVLRSIARAVCPAQEGGPPRAADILPISPRAFRRLDRAVFPDPNADPAGYLAAAWSLPVELARKWLAAFGGLDAAIPIAAHADARPPLILRVNSLLATPADVLRRLGEQSVPAVAHANGLSVVLTESVDVTQLGVFARGLVQPQDASPTAVLADAPIAPGMRVLDLCAAPGTKTTHLGERMANSGEIYAADVSPEKLARVEENCRRMGISIVRTVPAERLAALLEAGPFDFVLVDAPCSNTGVLARRPEARWRFSVQAMSGLARDQQSLLLLAAQMLARGGACVYSTCSLEEQENQQVVRYVLARRKDLELRGERRTLPAGTDDPARWCDGGYSAVLRRR